MLRRSLRRSNPAFSLIPLPAVPVVLPGLAAGLSAPGHDDVAAILAGVAAGALMVMILAWTVLRRVARRPRAQQPARNVDLSTLRSISLDGDAIDAALNRSDAPVPITTPGSASSKVDPQNIPTPPVLASPATDKPSTTLSTAPKLRLGTTAAQPAGPPPATPPPTVHTPSRPPPVPTASPSIKLSPSAGPRLHGQTNLPASRPVAASVQEPAAPATAKPVSLHERIQAIDAGQMVAVMRAVFERQGYHPLARPEPDRQVERDFALEKDGEVTLVSCRPAAEPRVGLQGIQEFADRMGSAGIAKGLLLTVKGYTFEARGGATSRGITIMDGPEVLRLLESVQAGTDPELSRVLSGPSPPAPAVPATATLKLARHD